MVLFGPIFVTLCWSLPSALTINIVSEIIEGPLNYNDVHILADQNDLELLSFNERKGSTTLVSYSNYDEPFWNLSPKFALMILRKNPQTFLDTMVNITSWNPRHILVVSLNESLNLSPTLESRTVRSAIYLSVVQRVLTNDAKSKYVVKVVSPFTNGKRDYTNTKLIGDWDSGQMFLTEDSLFPYRFSDFEGYSLSLATWCYDFPILDSYVTDEGVGCEGSNIDNLKVIGKSLNFTFKVQMVPDEKAWGALVKGRWTGMLGDLAYRGKDLAINSFFLNSERAKDFDFTHSYKSEGFTLLIANPSERPKWIGLVDPFTPLVWITVMISTGVLLAFFLFLLCLRRKYQSFEWTEVSIIVCHPD